MKKPFLLASAISTAVVICLFTTSVAFAAPIIEVEKSISTEEGGPTDEADTEPGPILDQGQAIWYVYDYTIDNSLESIAYEYTLMDDSIDGVIYSDIVEAGAVPVVGRIAYALAAAAGQHYSFVTLTATPAEGTEGGEEATVTDDLYYYGIPGTTEIAVDIKPGSDPNSINLRSQGVVPVALIDFDPSVLEDPNTVITFAGATALRWAVEDVDGDGDLDVICHFKTQELVDLNAASTGAGLEISTIDEVANQEVISYAGEDTVNIVPKGEAKGHAKANSSSTGSTGDNGNKGGNGKNKNK